MTKFFGGVQHVYCAKFILTVSHNGNPVIYNNYKIKYVIAKISRSCKTSAVRKEENKEMEKIR